MSTVKKGFDEELAGWSKLFLTINKLQWWVFFPLVLLATIWIFRAPLSSMLDNHFNPRPSITQDLTNNSTILDMMEVLADSTEADRVYLMVFHNGTKYYTGSHVNKMNMRFELVQPGIESVALNNQNIPVSLYTKALQETIAGRFRYGDVNQIPDIRTRVSMKANGVISVACVPCFDTKGELIGILGFEFIKTNVDRAGIAANFKLKSWDSDKLYNHLRIKAQEIALYL